MELGVLEFGLKNREISSVALFLRIQTEAFKSHHSSKPSTPTRLIEQWLYIFEQITLVARASDVAFTTKLVKVACQAISRLLLFYSSKNNLDEREELFVNKLSQHLKKIRHFNSGTDVEEAVPALPPQSIFSLKEPPPKLRQQTEAVIKTIIDSVKIERKIDRELAATTNVPSDQLIYFLWKSTFDSDLRAGLSEHAKVENNAEQEALLVNIRESNCQLFLSIETIERLRHETNGFFVSKESVGDPESLRLLVFFNQPELLQNVSSNCPIGAEIIASCPVLIKDELFELIPSDEAIHKFGSESYLVYKAYQNIDKEKAVKSVYKFSIDHDLFEMQLWLLIKFHYLENDRWPPGLINSLREDKKPNTVSIIQDISSIVTESNATIDTVIKHGMHNVALAWLMLLGTAENCNHPEDVIKFFRETYPVVGESIPAMDSTVHSSNIYKLIHESFPFNATSVFLWQSLNPIFDASKGHSIPHFSKQEFEDVPGLQFTPLHLYYLREGRPLDAYYSLEDQDTNENVLCFKFESCDVAASNIVLNELLNGNSYRLRLISSVASKVLEYSRPFLGLKSVQQEQELNRLIRKSLVSNEESSKIKLLHLLVQSIRSKYRNSGYPSMNEAIEWDLVLKFCKRMTLDPPLDFLIKCADSDDWLLFTVFAQLNDFDKELVMKSLSHFNNQCISDHLKKAFDSSSCLETSSTPAIVKVNRRTTAPGLLRSTLYNKIGLHNRNPALVVERGRRPQGRAPSTIGDNFDDMRSVTSEDVTNVETISFFSGNSAESGEGSTVEWPFKDNLKSLYDAIIYCSKKYPKMMDRSLFSCALHNRNPILLFLSASLPSPSLSPFETLYWWLFLHSGSKVPSDGPSTRSISDILLFLSSFLKSTRGLYLLGPGLDLFGFEKSPITLLLKFLTEFLIEKEFHKNINLLKLYQEEYWRLDSHSNPLFDRETVARISVIIFVNSIRATSSSHELKLLLRHLDFARVQNMFPEEILVPDIRRLYRMVQSVSDLEIRLPVSELLTVSNQIDGEAVLSVVDSLQEKEHFNEAFSFASAAGIDMSTVLFREWRMKMNNIVDDFWLWIKVLEKLKRKGNRDVIIPLINDFIDRVNCNSTKALLWTEKCIQLNSPSSRDVNSYSLEPSEPSFTVDPNDRIMEAEKSLVLLLLQIQVDSEQESKKEDDAIWKLISEEGNNLWRETKLDTIQLNPKEMAAIEVIISKLVSSNLELAQRFSSIFSHESEQLQLVKTCDSLARKNPDALNFLPNCVASLIPKDIDLGSNQFIQTTLERLSSFQSGSKIACQRICLYFKIARIINRSFEEVSSEKDHLAILRQLLRVGSIESYSLAKELVAVNKPKDEQVAEVICSELVNALKTDSPEVSENSSSTEPGSSFLSQLRLLNETSILGRLILSKLKESTIDTQPMYVVVELYIKAHDCFTMASDIEGIATVLRNVKVLIMNHLSQREDFNSMIRLLTKIGRYSEMTYIFDLLKEHHKFELLLGRRIEKAPQLRVALLDSLKGDKDMYPMVALNFSMHREIADMLQSDALKIIRSFRKQMSPVVRDLLERSLADLVDASESYSKASCYNQSRKCSLLAQLVALQICYLDTDVTVLNLSPAAVTEFLSKHDNFVESLTVAEAYNHQRSWSLAMYHNVVKKGDFGYLRDVQSFSSILNENILEEVVNKYQQDPNQDSSMEHNLRKLISTCPNVDFYARQPRNLINPQSRDDDCYLKDILRQNLV